MPKASQHRNYSKTSLPPRRPYEKERLDQVRRRAYRRPRRRVLAGLVSARPSSRAAAPRRHCPLPRPLPASLPCLACRR